MKEVLDSLSLRSGQVMTSHGRPTEFGSTLLSYFRYRAKMLNEQVEPKLMDVDRAEAVFRELRKKLNPKCPIPMNKQKGKKKAPAYFTGIVNMLIEANAGGMPCDYTPRRLTTVTRNGRLVRTLARWVDGAFPSVVNPVAVWEIKEYYYTTTFGSRVADGIYESLLDGMELKGLREKEKIDIKHFLMVDSHFTWWGCGKSYLCRLVDMLHMGYVDQVLFGQEVVKELPRIVRSLVRSVRRKGT